MQEAFFGKPFSEADFPLTLLSKLNSALYAILSWNIYLLFHFIRTEFDILPRWASEPMITLFVLCAVFVVISVVFVSTLVLVWT